MFNKSPRLTSTSPTQYTPSLPTPLDTGCSAPPATPTRNGVANEPAVASQTGTSRRGLHKRPRGPVGQPVVDRPNPSPESPQLPKWADALVSKALERFWDKVEVRGDCWFWRGAKTGDGYGTYWDGFRFWNSHRFAYVMFVGEVPEGYVIDHLCREPRCCNPAHLEAVTPYENFRRGERPGRKASIEPIRIADAEKWERAKREFGLSGPSGPDGTLLVRPVAGLRGALEGGVS